MKQQHTIKINFHGGIISPGELYEVLTAAGNAGIAKVKFGLRQQLLIDVTKDAMPILQNELTSAGIVYETDADAYPNIVSSYPAEEVFITKSWLSEGVYKDILDNMDYQPRLKINISDSNQSFTPFLTGNINWVAAPEAQHFWHLLVRFPKTNSISEYSELVYTNDVARMSKKIEEIIFSQGDVFYDNPQADGKKLFAMLAQENYITQPARSPAQLPAFNLPYYEGLNRYNNRYWLGIYRRDELFSIEFLKDLCRLCLQTKIGLLCSTPWKTIIVKSMEEKDRLQWNALLAKYKINVRHAANELNFQVEDNSAEGLALKNYLLKRFHEHDMRTFGLCIGIKTRQKSEVFSSILVRRRALLNIFGYGFFYVYDILCAHEFNPNERTGFVFSSDNPKFLLAEQLRRAVFSFYNHLHTANEKLADTLMDPIEIPENKKGTGHVHQCSHCLTIYDETAGEPGTGIEPGTPFEALPRSYTCPLCEGSKKDFVKKEKWEMGLHAV